MGKMKEIEKIEFKVEQCLEISERARDHDGILWVEYIRLHHGVPAGICNIILNILKETPAPETIRRTRQKLQAEGKFRGKKFYARHMLDFETKNEIRKNKAWHPGAQMVQSSLPLGGGEDYTQESRE